MYERQFFKSSERLCEYIYENSATSNTLFDNYRQTMTRRMKKNLLWAIVVDGVFRLFVLMPNVVVFQQRVVRFPFSRATHTATDRTRDLWCFAN